MFMVGHETGHRPHYRIPTLSGHPEEHKHGEGHDDDLVLAPLPDVPAHVELVLGVALLPDQVVELIHGQADDVLLLTNRNGRVF